jgi:endonuclease/exonuclease/phosphatase family metal-dependent hydrolase
MHDVPWLACIIATLDVQALAVQEVVQNPRGRGALLDLLRELDARSAGHWRAELDECPEDGRQHLGFLYDETRVELLAKHIFGELNPARSACDTRLRPGFSVRLRWKKGGPDFDALTVHLDSGAILRDYAHRGTSIERLAQVLPQLSGHKQHDDDVVVLGDFNTMGCSACEPKVAAEDELAAFDASVDALKPSLQNVTPTHPCTEYYKGHGGRLDHVLVTRGMRELTDPPRVETHGLCETLACSHFPSASHVTASVRLSDHCPLVLELRASDLD